MRYDLALFEFIFLFCLDFFTQAQGGAVSYDVALDVYIAVMEQEENFYVWDAAQNVAEFLKNRLGNSKGVCDRVCTNLTNLA